MIELGIATQRSNLALWALLLETVAQAPVGLLPEETEQRAYDALERAERHHDVGDDVTAILLYTWFFTSVRGDPENAFGVQHNLGIAYSDLPGGDRQANLEQTITCYQQALAVFQSARIDYYARMVSENIEDAQRELQGLSHDDEG